MASVGSVGDAYDNSLAESFVDSFKTELIADRVWRTRSQLELAVVEYVGWFNHDRLHEALGDLPPAEFEALYNAQDMAITTSIKIRKPTNPVSVAPRTAHWHGDRRFCFPACSSAHKRAPTDCLIGPVDRPPRVSRPLLVRAVGWRVRGVVLRLRIEALAVHLLLVDGAHSGGPPLGNLGRRCPGLGWAHVPRAIKVVVPQVPRLTRRDPLTARRIPGAVRRGVCRAGRDHPGRQHRPMTRLRLVAMRRPRTSGCRLLTAARGSPHGLPTLLGAGDAMAWWRSSALARRVRIVDFPFVLSARPNSPDRRLRPGCA